jgi:hypothetical protein
MQELQVGCKTAAREGGRMKTIRGTWVGVALLAGVSGVMGVGQRQGSNPPPQPPSRTTTNYPPMVGMTPMSGMDPSSSPDVLSSRMAEQQARSRNYERQKKLESDTARLVGLVNDFKERLQNGGDLSPADMSKRAEEIEKLAKSVKDRMKG